MRRSLTLHYTSAVWIISLLAAFGLIASLFFRFDRNEASVVNGKSKELNSSWSLVDVNGIRTDIALPRTIVPAADLPSVISTYLNSNYSGMMLDLTINNASIRALVDGEIIYESILKNGITKSTNLIYLPELSGGNELTIELYPISNGNMVVRSAAVSRGDIAVINRLKDSLFQLFCSVLILLSIVVLSVLELVRKHSGWEEQYLFRLSWFGVIVLVYVLISTQIPSMFLGNDEIFYSLNGASLALLPMLFFNYYDSVSLYPDSLLHRLLFFISVLSGVVGALLYTIPVFSGYISFYIFVPYVALAVIVVADIVSAFTGREGFVWILEVVGLFFLLLFCVLSIAGNWIRFDKRNLEAISVTLSLIVLSAWQTTRLILDYRAVVEKSEQEALRASEAKGRFLANMSHEIRTPINAVLGMDEMILRNAKDPDIRAWAFDISSAGNSLLSIINDILDISKIESGKMEIVPVDYDSVRLLHDTVIMFTPRFKEKGLAFNIEVDPDLPSGLYGDDTRLRQVMANLLSNAVKYTKKGAVWFRIKWDADNSVLKCEVKDTGIGIKKKDIPKLFEEYQRIEEGRIKNIEGTGLGMNITMAMLSLMNSQLNVKSVYGKGSLFWFEVEQEVTDDTPIGDFMERSRSLIEDYSYVVAFKAPEARILVVDDNDLNRKVFKSLLSDTLIKITDVSSGEECLKLVSKEYYDIIFLDHMMPDMDGIETLKRLRAMKGCPCADTPVYVLTANAIAGAKEKYMAAGFDGFITKPIVSGRLEQTIMDTLPDDLIKEVGSSVVNSPGKELSLDIDGVDIAYAGLHFSDDEHLLSALKDFYNGMGTLKTKLTNAYAGLPGTLDRYRIEVHSMKGAAATVGNIQLFGITKTLENAAKCGDTKTIGVLHPIFISLWDSFRQTLDGYFNKTKQDKRIPKKSVVVSLLSLVKTAIEASDIDRADDAMNELMKYKYSTEITRLMDDLKVAVDDIDYEKVVAISDDLLKIIKA